MPDLRELFQRIYNLTQGLLRKVRGGEQAREEIHVHSAASMLAISSAGVSITPAGHLGGDGIERCIHCGATCSDGSVQNETWRIIQIYAEKERQNRLRVRRALRSVWLTLLWQHTIAKIESHLSKLFANARSLF